MKPTIFIGGATRLPFTIESGHSDSRRPQLTYSLTYPPAQQRSQSVAVRIPDLLSNAINGELARLEQMNGALHPQILNVLDGRFT